MKKAIQIASYTLGGATLLGGSFFLFAAMSGTPMSDVGGVGDMFPDDPEQSAAASQDVPSVDEILSEDRRGSEQVFLEAASPLRTFVLENPFSAGELELLEKRLENRMQEVRDRDLDLDAREARLAEREAHVDRQYDEITALRNQLLEERDELIHQKAEADRDSAAVDEKEKASWKAVSALFEEGKAKDQAQMLIDGYEAAEAGQLLAHLSVERVRELLAAVHKIDAETYEAMEKAWRSAIR